MGPHLLPGPNTLSVVRTMIWYNRHLRGINVDMYTAELVQKTDGYGDCCMLTLLDSEHARNELAEDVNDFETEDHMDHVGEFSFQVNEAWHSIWRLRSSSAH